MTPESLSRTMKALAEDGVAVKGMQLVITDRERLMAVATNDVLMDGPDPRNPTALPPATGR